MADEPIAGRSRMARDAFIGVLRAAASPALPEGGAMYDACVQAGVRAEVALAFFQHESTYGKFGVCKEFDTRSLGNVRTPSNPAYGGVVFDTGTAKGFYTRYPSWELGARDWCDRLLGPKYAGAGLTTVRGVIPKYAPSSDNNVPERYSAAVLAALAGWGVAGGTAPMPRIALAAGHHNTDGGNRFEYDTVGRLTPAIARACRARGMDVRVVQGGDPCDDYPGGIWDVAAQVVRWADEGWVPDVFLETHTQGVGNTSVRGVFVIYPDWDGDLDTDTRDRLGPLVVRKVRDHTGIPIWSNGLMSERRTGVGLTGYRLGILNRTAAIKGTTTRLLIEYGAHSNPEDARIHRTDAFYEGAARATAEAFA